MSQTPTFTLTTPDGVDLFTYCWLPIGGPKNDQPKAVVQIAHGLAEHAGRCARISTPPREARVGDHEPATQGTKSFRGRFFAGMECLLHRYAELKRVSCAAKISSTTLRNFSGSSGDA
jgi:hypothetical protein